MLIVDDNVQIARVLQLYAEKEGFKVDLAHDGSQALEKFRNNSYDIILLDVMMPEPDGFEVAREIRKTSVVPIILITAKGEDYDRIMGLDIGADDYIVKPFSSPEVMARVRAVLRRVEMPESAGSNRMTLGRLRLDHDSYQASYDDQDLSLTPKEFDLLWTLGKNHGQVFTRNNLLDSIWGYDYYGDPRTVDTHIRRLRAKLPEDDWGAKVVTVRGLGYKLELLER